MLRKATLLFVFVMLIAVLGSNVLAHGDYEHVAAGLNNPRQITYAADGTLFIAEAGKGGDVDVVGAFGPLKAGLTAQITAISAEGEQSVAVPELISMDAGFGQIEGAMAVYPTDESLWLVLGMGPVEPVADFEGKTSAALVELDRETLEVKQTVDLQAFETENNPDAAEELVANPADIAVDADGKVFIADASANALLTWTADDGIAVFAVWEPTADAPSAVPTSVAIGPDGDVYVGFLSGFPFPTGGARIERYAADGTLKETYEGLTMVTDVLVDADGNLYAVQMASEFNDTGYKADSGSIVKVTADGLETIAEELNYPYGAAMDADGNFVVTINSAFVEPDSGEVVMIAMETES